MPDPLRNRESEQSPAEWFTRYQRRLKAVTNWWDEDWKRHEENYNFFYGAHLSSEDKARNKKAERTSISLPDIPVNTLSITGREIISRVQTAFKGRSDDDRPVAQAITEADRWLSYEADSAQQDSDAFLDLFVCGIGWKQTYLDNHKSLDGGAIVEDQPYPWEVGADPSATKKNLTDRRYQMRWKWISEHELPLLFPDADIDLDSIKGKSVSYTGKAQSTADESNIDRKDGGRTGLLRDAMREEVQVCEYEFLDLEVVYRWNDGLVQNPVVGEDGLPAPVERSGSKAEFEAYQAQLEASELPQLEPASIERDGYLVQRVEVYKKAFLLGDQILQEPQIMKWGTWSFECMTGFPHKMPDGTRWFCPVDLGKDAQLWKDRMGGILIDTYAVSPKQGIWMEENVLVNEKDGMLQLARPGGRVKFKAGALSNKQVVLGQTPSFPTFPAQLLELFQNGVGGGMGVSPYTTGQVTDIRRAPFAGIDLIQKAGQSVFATMFDSLKLFRKRNSILKIKIMAAFLEWETVARAIGEEHAANLPQPDDNGDWSNLIDEIQKFDLVADEMPAAASQKAAVLDTLPQLIGVVKETGMPFPPTILIGILESAQLVTSAEAEQWLEAIKQATDRPNPDEVPISEQERLAQQEAANQPPQQTPPS